VIRLGLAVALWAVAASCADNSTSPSADAGTDGSDGSDGSLSPDVGTPGSCLAIRACVSGCAEPGCVQDCVERGTAAARALYGQLQDCTSAACPDAQDETCRCEAACIFPGACTGLQDMCSEGMDDPQCVRCF
jgi:hypothetical protein